MSHPGDFTPVCAPVTFPIAADPNRFIAGLYGMIHESAGGRDAVRLTAPRWGVFLGSAEVLADPDLFVDDRIGQQGR